MRALLAAGWLIGLTLVAFAQGRKQPAAKPPLDPAVYLKLPAVDPVASTARAIRVLVSLPEGDRRDQWPYEGVYREDAGQIPIGYRVGGTSIVGLALLAAPGYEEDSERADAVQRGLAFVLATLDVPRMSVEFEGRYDVRGWGHIFALQFFLALLDTGRTAKPLEAPVRDKTRWLVGALVDSRIPGSGGWNYSRPAGYMNPENRASTFMTAPALQALFHARARGYEVPDRVLEGIGTPSG